MYDKDFTFTRRVKLKCYFDQTNDTSTIQMKFLVHSDIQTILLTIQTIRYASYSGDIYSLLVITSFFPFNNDDKR